LLQLRSKKREKKEKKGKIDEAVPKLQFLG
jgi:hypothetical protein